MEKRKLEITNDIESKYEELDSLQSNLALKETEINELTKKIDVLKNQHTEEQNRIRENIKYDIAQLEQQREKLDYDIDIERKIKSETLNSLRQDIDFNERRKKELETAIRALQKDFTTEQKDAQEKLSELVKQNTHFNFISGRDLNTEKDENSTYLDFTLRGTKLTDYKSIRDQINVILKKQQRYFESHFIDNLLISIYQNTITLFAGMPGTGKTSLAKIITAALAPIDRIKEIPVARGWTSQKDLIGFSNPLSKKFHESQTGLYRLLKQLNFEWNSESFFDSPLAFVILDEANLSPLEHYWSTFYNMTDSHASKTRPMTINLGQSEVLKHANTLRFIGTINYDQTTEELSPRILDRTNIIRLMPPKQLQSDNYSQNEIEALNIAFREIIDIFKLFDFNTESSSIQISAELSSKFDEIKETFNKLNIYISPRVEFAIKRYCNVASKFMTEESRPLDYCIAQRLLPLINIQGNKKNELDNLLQQIKNLNLDNSVSATILEEIIRIGNRTGYTQDNYNYFLTLSHV